MSASPAARDDRILALAAQLEAMPPHGRVSLPARAGRVRAVKVERCGGQDGLGCPAGWAAWNVGRLNGLVVADPLDMAERLVDAYAAAEAR